jgi:hypothetical protein
MHHHDDTMIMMTTVMNMIIMGATRRKPPRPQVRRSLRLRSSLAAPPAGAGRGGAGAGRTSSPAHASWAGASLSVCPRPGRGVSDLIDALGLLFLLLRRMEEGEGCAHSFYGRSRWFPQRIRPRQRSPRALRWGAPASRRSGARLGRYEGRPPATAGPLSLGDFRARLPSP